jgi:hypothetical protein
MKNVLVLEFNGEFIDLFESVEGVVKFLKKEWCVEDLVLSSGKVSVEEGVGVLFEKKKMKFYNDELVEMGDDYCTMKLFEIQERVSKN